MDIVRLTVPPLFGSIRQEAASRKPLPSVSKPFSGYLQQAVETRSVQSTTVHEVKPGETLWKICRDSMAKGQKNVPSGAVHEAVQKVAAANRLSDPDKLQVGQRLDLSVLNTDPRQTPSRSRQAVSVITPTISRGLELALLRETTDIPRTSPGDSGSSFSKVSTVSEPRSTVQDITGYIEDILSKAPAAASSSPSKNVLSWQSLVEISQARITSGFGMRKDPFTGDPEYHEGIDIAAPTGTAIYPLKAGEVTFSGWNGRYGRCVVVQHDDGTQTRYAHASRLFAKKGDRVDPKTMIAQVGSSGRATGPHLHFEYRVNGKAVDPMSVFRKGSALQVASRF